VDTDRARIERDLDRRRFLNRKALTVFLENGSPLTAAEKAELSALNEWRSSLPPHLRGGQTLREVLGGDSPSPTRQRTYEEPAEARKRMVADLRAPAEVKAKAPVMMNSIDSNCINIAVLLKKYANFCQRLSQDADPRLKEWIACAHARQQGACGGEP
jgi:hypothetical protein